MTDRTKPPRRAGGAPLAGIIAEQAAQGARLDDVVRRIEQVEQTSGEARDNTRDILATLREQDTSKRLAEQRAEYRQLVQDLREDVVRANGSLKEEIRSVEDAASNGRSRLHEKIERAEAALVLRITPFENMRAQGTGVAKGVRWTIAALKMVVTALGGAGALRLLEALGNARHH
jgi:hypothetical protein